MVMEGSQSIFQSERFKTKRWKRSNPQIQNKTLQIIKTVKTQESTLNYTTLMTKKLWSKAFWTEDMGQFLCYLDPETRTVTRVYKKWN